VSATKEIGGSIELVRFEDIESRRETWTELAARSGNIFATWEWISTWLRHFGAGVEPLLVECRQDERPFAILPLCTVRRGPLRFSRFIGFGVGDVLGPICDPADAALAGEALRRATKEVGAPALLLAENLPGGEPAQAVGGSVLQRVANPRLDFEGAGWEEFLSTRSRNVREKVRRSARKLETAHAVSYRLAEDPDGLGADFDQLIRLHRLRWGSEGPLCQERIAAFHRDLAGELLAKGWLRLWLMELDGEAAAAWYGYRFERTESFYQGGRDPRFDRLSVGFLMLTWTIKAAFDDGLERYAFLRGDEPYKDRFASAGDGLETRLRGQGPFGSAAVAAMRSAPLRHRAAKLVS
jgi:CelD/BcsL family acetyltransferase involved in cellulose biosynthesis